MEQRCGCEDFCWNSAGLGKAWAFLYYSFITNIFLFTNTQRSIKHTPAWYGSGIQDTRHISMRNFDILDFFLLYMRPKDVFWYPNSMTFFPLIGLKFFCRLFRPSGLRNDQWEKCLWVRASVSQWVCESESPWARGSVTKIQVEPFLYLNMLQSALNLVHMFNDTVPREDFF